jgi:hypothetical protein
MTFRVGFGLVGEADELQIILSVQCSKVNKTYILYKT